ncbi:hypothetical protein FK220_009665 [Flavobacteriaceae bacterium TP-CH-4]|uniref:TPM domain-containing protein n=1 Tax=Pelagihabitans pacificus TaxID=2696054 RepID=A0A967AXW5_9FLAO|nr:hypothetical protein [Pelagihabitans pacificus]NHF59607.1 hypothetical protein [Pelagihabitans pacificus]
MKRLKKILSVLVVMMVVFFVFLFWYQQRYSMDRVTAYEVNTPALENSLLIATQGSDFKNALTQELVNYYKTRATYIKVIDVHELTEIDMDAFNAIVIMHTWENWKPPEPVAAFIEENKEQRNRMVVVATSGEGSYKIEGVDALTGESIIENVPQYVNKITDRLALLFDQNP